MRFRDNEREKERVAGSVTRFGEITPLWQNYNSLWHILDIVYCLGIWQTFVPYFDNFSATGKIYNDVNGH